MVLFRLLAALFLVLLVSPATSQAKAADPVRAATAAAERYWGATPCGGKIRVLVRQQPAGAVEPDSDAWVTFDSSLGANNLAAPASSYTRCVVAFGLRRWPTTSSLREDWDMFCATMVHEMGHLLGRAHDLAPGSVMAPVFTDVSGVPPICRATRPDRVKHSARGRR